MSAGKIFRAFEGQWNVAGELFYLDKKNGLYRGVAQFIVNETKDQYAYKEQGILLRAGDEIRVVRQFRYAYEKERFLVFHEEIPLQIFYTLQFEEGYKIAKGSYCHGSSTHEATYEFLNENAFKQFQRTHGPMKDARYITSFTKITSV